MSIMRKFCYQCMKAHCLCDQVIQIKNQKEVIILQHADERKHPKNTAQLLHLSLKNSHIIRDKNFNTIVEELIKKKNYALVFPETNTLSKEQSTSNSLEEMHGIILIDGTWKKAKKIYYENRTLQTLPKICIKNKENQYIIRKSPTESALSTYEAAYFALKELNEEKIDLIYPLFKTFINMTLSKISNYKKGKK